MHEALRMMRKSIIIQKKLTSRCLDLLSDGCCDAISDDSEAENKAPAHSFSVEESHFSKQASCFQFSKTMLR